MTRTTLKQQASIIETLQQQLQQQAEELAALKALVKPVEVEPTVPETPTIESHWQTKTGEYIPYDSMTDKHLFCALQKMKNWQEHPRYPFLIKEAERRWKDVYLSVNFASRYCCPRVYNFVKEYNLPDRGSLSLLVKHIDKPEKGSIFVVMYHALCRAGYDVTLPS